MAPERGSSRQSAAAARPSPPAPASDVPRTRSQHTFRVLPTETFQQNRSGEPGHGSTDGLGLAGGVGDGHARRSRSRLRPDELRDLRRQRHLPGRLRRRDERLRARRRRQQQRGWARRIRAHDRRDGGDDRRGRSWRPWQRRGERRRGRRAQRTSLRRDGRPEGRGVPPQRRVRRLRIRRCIGRDGDARSALQHDHRRHRSGRGGKRARLRLRGAVRRATGAGQLARWRRRLRRIRLLDVGVRAVEPRRRGAVAPRLRAVAHRADQGGDVRGHAVHRGRRDRAGRLERRRLLEQRRGHVPENGDAGGRGPVGSDGRDGRELRRRRRQGGAGEQRGRRSTGRRADMPVRQCGSVDRGVRRRAGWGRWLYRAPPP